MPAPTISTMPPAPSRTDAPATFTALAEAFVEAMEGMPAEYNALATYLEGITGSSGPITATALTMATARLLGRTTASTGAIEEISLGGGFTFASGVLRNIETFQVAMSDMTTALTTGDAKAGWVVPYDCTILEVFTALTAAQSSSGPVTIDARLAGTTIFSAAPSIEANEDTSLTGTAGTLSTTAATKGQIMLFDIDAAGTGAKGLIATVSVRRT